LANSGSFVFCGIYTLIIFLIIFLVVIITLYILDVALNKGMGMTRVHIPGTRPAALFAMIRDHFNDRKYVLDHQAFGVICTRKYFIGRRNTFIFHIVEDRHGSILTCYNYAYTGPLEWPKHFKLTGIGLIQMMQRRAGWKHKRDIFEQMGFPIEYIDDISRREWKPPSEDQIIYILNLNCLP